MLVFNQEKEKAYIVIGAGGTGGWLIPSLSKLDVNAIIVDGDVVEQKNIARQNFANADIGKCKAEVIGDRYEFPYVDSYVDSVEMLKEIVDSVCDNGQTPVIVGCVDNNGSRKLVHDLFNLLDDIIWVDSGNSERNGQVYVAVKENGEVKAPSPIDIEPAFQNYEGDQRRPDQISCAEHSESAPQNVTANVMAAATLFQILAIIQSGGALMGNKYVWSTQFISLSLEK